MNLPRMQVGPNPQHLAVTLIGHYWGGEEVELPSAGLVDLLALFSITPSSGRRALVRLVERGVLTSRRSARRTLVRPTPEAVTRGVANRAAVLSFGSEAWETARPPAFFGLSFTTRPGAAVRRQARRLVESMGFVAVQEGMWVGANVDITSLERDLAALGGVSATIIRGVRMMHLIEDGVPPAITDLAREYQDFIDRYAPLRSASRQQRLSGAEAIVMRTEVMGDWRALISQDPGLPPTALPSDWPRARARRTLVDVYDGLAEAAESHCLAVLRAHDPAAPEPLPVKLADL